MRCRFTEEEEEEEEEEVLLVEAAHPGVTPQGAIRVKENAPIACAAVVPSVLCAAIVPPSVLCVPKVYPSVLFATIVHQASVLLLLLLCAARVPSVLPVCATATAR
jgi:hypothetical protein